MDFGTTGRITNVTDVYDNRGQELDDLLNNYNDAMAVKLIPVVLFLGILILVGVPGNIMVCFYYGLKTRRSTNSVFICTVALYDIISCCISMPMEIVDNRNFYTFKSGPTCKFLRFTNHFSSIGSGLTLVIIAVDRFRRICRPFKKQLCMRTVRLACGATAIGAVLLSWPAAVFYDSVSMPIKNDLNRPLVGHDCTTSRADDYKTFIMMFNSFHFVIFIASLVILVVMYSLVGRVLFRHKRTQRLSIRPRASRSVESASWDGSNLIRRVSSSITPSLLKPSELSNKSERINHVTFDTTNDMRNDGITVPANLQVSLRNKTKTSDEFDIKTVKFTMIMIVIALAFILSFLPYLILMVWRTLQTSYESDIFHSDAVFAIYQLGIRSYFLNSATNPLTYGFFNSKFRSYYKSLFIGLCYKDLKRPEQRSAGAMSSDTC